MKVVVRQQVVEGDYKAEEVVYGNGIETQRREDLARTNTVKEETQREAWEYVRKEDVRQH